jgi:hypothetical protein
VLFGQERGHRLQGTVEVETGESVNSLEAMAQWGPFSRLRAPFYLYIPPASIDSVRRLCLDHHIPVAEIWTYHVVADQVRFTMVHRSQEAIDAAAKAAAEKPEKPAAAKVAPKATAADAKPANGAKVANGARPAKDAKPAPEVKPAVAKPAVAKPAAAKPAAAKTAKPVAKTAKPVAKTTKAVTKAHGGNNGKAVPARPAPVKAAPARAVAKKAPAKPAARTTAKAKPAARKR